MSNKTKKTYIGTTDQNERVFIDWILSEDGCFSASANYWNAAGTDLNHCGQCIDQVIKDFPESEQAQAISEVWSKYHMNDVQAGTPKQMEALEGIKATIEKRQGIYDELAKKYKIIQGAIREKIEKVNYHNPNNSRNAKMFDSLMNDIDVLKESSNIVRHITSKGIFKGYKAGAVKVKINQDDVALIKRFHAVSRPQFDYDNICAELNELGLLFDREHMIETETFDELTQSTITTKKPYKYGSAWLKLEIPADIIKEIESWQEVAAPDELTPIEQFIQNHATLIESIVNHVDGYSKSLYHRVKSPWDGDNSVNKWCIQLENNGKSEVFDYFTGEGIDTQDHHNILSGAISSLMADASMIALNDDPIEHLIDDLGYDYYQARDIAKGCSSIYEKLNVLGLYDEVLAR